MKHLVLIYKANEEFKLLRTQRFVKKKNTRSNLKMVSPQQKKLRALTVESTNCGMKC